MSKDLAMVAAVAWAVVCVYLRLAGSSRTGKSVMVEAALVVLAFAASALLLRLVLV